MGVAAYWRGSKAISDGIARDAYRAGRSWYDPDRPPPKPTPRPETWGDKVATKAAALVECRLKVAQQIAGCRGEHMAWTDDDIDAAIEHLAERHRIGRATLRRAFDTALKPRLS